MYFGLYFCTEAVNLRGNEIIWITGFAERPHFTCFVGLIHLLLPQWERRVWFAFAIPPPLVF